MRLSVGLASDSSGYSDVLVTLEDVTNAFDSYYLTFDPKVSPDKSDEVNARSILSILLVQWVRAVRSLEGDDVVYLPCDFSPESSCWLRCRSINSVIEVNMCSSWMDGWLLIPSEVGVVRSLKNFKVLGKAAKFSKEEIIESINESIDKLL